MQRRETKRISLTNRLLTLAAAIVVVTTLLVVVTSGAGVYRMAVEQESARQTAYREVLVSEIEGRLAAAYRVVRNSAAPGALSGDDSVAVRRTLTNGVVESAQFLEGLTLVAGDGSVIGTWPDAELGPSQATLSRLVESTATVSPLAWGPGAGAGGIPTLWAAAPLQADDGSRRVLVGRVRIEFIQAALDEVATASGPLGAMLTERDGTPLRMAGIPPEVSSSLLEFSPDEPTSSLGSLKAGGHVGYYADLETPRGVSWRVIVMEPAEQAWRETFDAITPGLLGPALSLIVALIASLYVVSRVTQPLKMLERRARALAAGLPIEMEPLEADDEIGRLLDAFNSIGTRLASLAEVAEVLARSSDRQLVLDGVVRSIGHMLGSVDVDVLLMSDDGDFDLVAASGALAGQQGVRVARIPGGWLDTAAATGGVVAVERGVDDPLLALHSATESAALAAPLFSGEDVIGLIAVIRPEGPVFDATESDSVRMFASQASIALQNSRLFEDERRSRAEAEALRAVAERVAASGPAAATLDQVGSMAARLLGFTDALVVLERPGDYGLGGGDDEGSRRWLRLWQRHTDVATRDGSPLLVSAEGCEPGEEPVFRAHAASAALLIPLSRAEAIVGVLVLTSGTRVWSIADHQKSMARTIGTQVSLALENARLYSEVNRRAENLETIFRISHAVASSLQSRIVLNRVLDVVQKILAADAVMLLTFDTRRKLLTVPMARGILNREMLETQFRPGEDVPGRVYETHEPERFDRLGESDTVLLNAAREQGLRSLLAVPLLARGKSIGVLMVFAESESAFTTDELDLLRTFASQAALAIDTAEMYSREHHVASVLRESILPSRLPHIPGIGVGSVYLPASEDAEIGGDYYDLFVSPNGRVVITIGDVCGKGVVAATRTSMLKYSIRGMVAAGLEPGRIIAELNAMLVESGDPTSIVTLWIGFLDITEGTLRYANGGHPPGLLMDPTTQKIERLSTTGALLGAVEGAWWTEHTTSMVPGATLLLYTDGVTEARVGPRFFGEGRVRRSLRQGGSAPQVAERLLASVRRFTSGDLRDDAAILTLVFGEAQEPSGGVS